MIQQHEVKTPNLDTMGRFALLSAANAAAAGAAEVTVSVTYDKQTDTKPRIAGEDYVEMPGVGSEVQTGTLMVRRRVDNPFNRRKGVAGQVYFKIKSVTRANGEEAFGYTNVRPEGLTGFVILGIRALNAEPQTPKQSEAEEPCTVETADVTVEVTPTPAPAPLRKRDKVRNAALSLLGRIARRVLG